jgi:hypothetical protein
MFPCKPNQLSHFINQLSDSRKNTLLSFTPNGPSIRNQTFCFIKTEFTLIAKTKTNTFADCVVYVCVCGILLEKVEEGRFILLSLFLVLCFVICIQVRLVAARVFKFFVSSLCVSYNQKKKN